jgi:hypothetical protein
MKRPQVLEEQDTVLEIGTPFRRVRTGPYRPRHMDTEHENQVNLPMLEHRQGMVAVRNRLNFVLPVVTQVLSEHRSHGSIPADQ